MNIQECCDLLLASVPEDAQARITRFRQEEGRHRALVRELLLRRILKETFGEREVILGKNTYGKPEIINVRDTGTGFALRESEKAENCAVRDTDAGVSVQESDRAQQDISEDPAHDASDNPASFSFNISHSGEYVVIGFGDGRIGIDVERTGRAKDFHGLLRFYSEAERQRVLSASDPEAEFYRVWTFREAFSKEVGVGLSLFEKKKAAINYEEQRVTFKEQDYRFFEYELPGYNLTACVGAQEQRPELEDISDEFPGCVSHFSKK